MVVSVRENPIFGKFSEFLKPVDTYYQTYSKELSPSLACSNKRI